MPGFFQFFSWQVGCMFPWVAYSQKNMLSPGYLHAGQMFFLLSCGDRGHRNRPMAVTSQHMLSRAKAWDGDVNQSVESSEPMLDDTDKFNAVNS